MGYGTIIKEVEAKGFHSGRQKADELRKQYPKPRYTIVVRPKRNMNMGNLWNIRVYDKGETVQATQKKVRTEKDVWLEPIRLDAIIMRSQKTSYLNILINHGEIKDGKTLSAERWLNVFSATDGKQIEIALSHWQESKDEGWEVYHIEQEYSNGDGSVEDHEQKR